MLQVAVTLGKMIECHYSLTYAKLVIPEGAPSWIHDPQKAGALHEKEHETLHKFGRMGHLTPRRGLPPAPQ